MTRLSAHDIAMLLTSLGILLASARFLGELAERFNQPAVLGELMAGIVLGPTVLGTLAPDLERALFPSSGERTLVFDGLSTLAVVMFLLVAGMEVELSTIWKQGRTAATVSLAGIAIPFTLGLAAGWWMPGVLGEGPEHDRRIFPLFFATALSISALPVIAKTLFDLNLYRSDFGMTVIAAAIFNDLIGWIIFAVILGMMGTDDAPAFGIGWTIALTLGFAAVTLSVGRGLLDRILPWIQAHASWPGGVLGFALALALLSAAFTEWIGIHAIFGSFLIGVAIGDSRHLREHTRTTISQFVSFIFAPIFFAGIGLKVNFAADFDLRLTAIVLVIACLGKIVGCGLGAQWSGAPPREAWAIGFAMNARGVMEIILGILALQYGVIREPMFIALVVMALATSLMGGPMIQRILRRKKTRRFTDFLKPKAFLAPLAAQDRREAIAELSRAVSGVAGLKPEAVRAAVLEREEIMPTGIGEGVAIPHARVEGLTAPVVGLGLSEKGIDFDAPDGNPARIIFLLLTPVSDDGAQVELLAHIARAFRHAPTREKILRVTDYTEFLGLLRTEAL